MTMMWMTWWRGDEGVDEYEGIGECDDDETDDDDNQVALSD